MGNRSDIRKRYNIRGTSGNDCLTVLCCRPCALAQEQREIQLEETSIS
jgi:Cys-rich protein (TIGR01571 family)